VAKIEFEFLGVCLGVLGDSAVAFERMSEELLDKTRNDQNKRGIHMRYMMKQKLFSLGADFTIKDEQGNDVYFVDGKFLSLRDELTFKDMAGNELCVLRRKLLSWGPTYEIYHQGQLVAVVKESLFTLFGHRFTVDDTAGPDDLEAQGSFSDHEYTFTRGGRAMASVSKAWFSIADTYGVGINDGQDDVLILAATVVIERCAQSSGHRNGGLGGLGMTLKI
jgi:uncharacterized protein YxjI